MTNLLPFTSSKKNENMTTTMKNKNNQCAISFSKSSSSSSSFSSTSSRRLVNLFIISMMFVCAVLALSTISSSSTSIISFVDATDPDICLNGCPAGYFYTNCSQGCSQCSAGYYCTGNTASPIACAAGTYSSNVGESAPGACQNCPEGTYSDVDGSTSCKPCTSVQRSPAGSTSCTACAVGEVGKLNTCTACAAGMWIDTTVNECTPCSAGYACPTKDRDKEIVCAAGEYSYEGDGVCTTCTAGFACPASAACGLETARNKVACQPGTYAGAGATSCTSCPAGFYCPTTTSATPLACAAGTYSLGGETQCRLCPSGHQCSNAAVAPVRCADGQYSNTLSCLACPVGSMCVDGLRQLCDLGTYAAAPSSTSCTVCPAGSYCASTTAAPVACGAGYFSDSGAIACTSCTNTNGLAVYQTASGAASCSICPAGSYCADPTLAPVACGAGTFSREGQSSCTSCQSLTVVGSVIAYYSTGSGNTACTMCPAGSSCIDPAVAPVPCSTGYYSIEGQLSCSICPAGFSCASASANPVPCAEGSYSSAGATSCTLCPMNFYCSSQAASPLQCPLGFFSGEGAGYCFQCPDGSSCAANGTNASSAIYSKCANGTYKTAAETNCTICPAGYFCPFTDQRPIACPFGYYSSQGWMNCSLCPAGTSCPNATALYPCLPGQYSRAGDGACTPCDPGYYCPDPAGLPIVCPLGTFATGSQEQCTGCPAGWACPSTARFLDAAYSCMNGTYSTGNKTVCTTCRAGFYCPSTTMNTEIACAAGSMSKRGSTECTVCEAGYACPYTDGDRYTRVPCQPGWYSLGGTTTCTKCAAGFGCPFTHNDTTIPCANGTFSFAGQPHCTTCSAGYYCPLATIPDTFAMFGDLGYAAQIPCGPGQYSPQGSFQCQHCPTGFYCTSQVAADGGRNVCPNGYYTAQGTIYVTQDATNCALCPSGSDCSIAGAAPSTCGFGSYVTEAGCFTCPAGFQCPNPGLAPTPCPAGTYSIGNATSCSNCAAGFLCDPMSTSASPVGSDCPLGGYCAAGATATTLCPAGFYGAIVRGTTVTDACVACSSGNFCPAGTAGPDGQKQCPEGHYCPPEACCPIPCPGGSYSGAIGAMSRATCQPCPEGFFCPPGSASYSGHACPPGFFCPTGTASGMENGCPPGTYGSEHRLSSASQCTQCPAGHKCPSSGLADPISCEAGEFQSQTGSTVCLSCEAGWACPNAGQTESFSTPCSVGHYCPRGTTDPRSYPCPGGSYTFRTNLRSAGECEVCWRGFHCPRGTGYVPAFPQPCAQGHYCPGADRRPVGRPLYSSAYQGQTASYATQYPCPAGTMSLAIDIWGASQCAQCPAGSWCAGALTVVSGPCDPGYYCPRGSATAKAIPCPAGTYNGATGSQAITDCIVCSPGNYCPEAATAEIPCPTGSYYPSQSATAAGPVTNVYAGKCIVCPAGFSCGSGATAPSPCSAGFFSYQGDSSCTSCVAGTYCPTSNIAADQATRLFLCPPGLYCPAGMSTYPNADTNPCPAGKYCPLGATTPISCPIGTYSPFKGRGSVGECLQCPKGFYCSTTGLTEPTGECQPGYYCPEGSNSATQYPCPARYYRNKPRAESEEFCAVCPRGAYCPEGTSSPLLCPSGFYCITGTDQPQPCPIGSFGNTTGLRDQDECTACTAGFYCDGIGLSAPTGLCDPGYYCVSRSSTSAPPGLPMGGLCPKGGYCPPGSSFPTACAEGTFNNYTGGSSQLDCVPCLPGFYCSGSNLPFPAGPCQAGYYCTGGAALPTQFRTPAGHYTGAGASNPIECPVGTFNPSPEQSACLPCSAGYYCPTRAMVTVIPCPPGGYCPAGTGIARACPRGSYQPFSYRQNVTDCIACDPGKYCDRLNATSVTGSCQAGFYCKRGCVDAFCAYYLLNGGVARNLLDTSTNENEIGGACPAGAYCPASSAVPTLCPIGTYRDALQGMTRLDCSACFPGFYCPTSGSSTLFTGSLRAPQRCQAGFYCPGPHPGTAPPYGCSGSTCASMRNESCTLTLNGCTGSTNQDLGDGNPSQRLCPTGFYCPEAVDRPLMCPVLIDGRTTYQPDRGQTSCLLCPRGRRCYQSNPLTLMTPDTCSPGYYCPLGTGLNPPPCPAGSWTSRNDLQNKTECSLCPAGRFCPNSGIAAVSTIDMPFCFGGYYCTSGAITGFGLRGTLGGIGGICPAGYYCPNGTKYNNSFSCPPGTYKSVLGGSSVTDCLDCTPGYYCFGSANIAVTGPCEAGYYCPRGCSDSKCTNKRCGNGILPPPGTINDGGPCPQGHYCPGTTVFPLQCPNGTYQDLYGQSDCKPCPEGFMCGTAQITPMECGRGRYCPANTSSFAVPECPPGTTNPSRFATNISACRLCPAGHYCPDWAMNNTKLLCAAGFYCVEGAAFPNGTAGPLGGVGAICPRGYYCLNGTRSAIDYPCPSGTLNPTLGGTNFSACIACTPGFYCNGTGLSAVSGPCDSGYYCPTRCEDNVCSNAPCSGNCPMPYAEGGLCPTGHYCPQRLVASVLTGSINPTPCPAGSYSPVPGSAICLTCPNGRWCGVNTTEPQPCPAGFYCAKGTQYPNQYPCPRGTFAPTVNNTNVTLCKLCSPGMYCEGLGNAAVTGSCFGGYYCSLGASTPYGVVGDRGGIAGICPAGHYCPNGTTSQYEFPCPVGTYNALLQQNNITACIWCDPGMYCATEGLVTPTGMCLGGYYCPRNCTDNTCSNMPCLTNLADPWLSPYLEGGVCPKGFKCPQTATRGAILPIACSPGTYQPATGQINCTDCPEGFYCPTNTSDPFPCPTGAYCGNGTGMTIPKCPSGTYNPNMTMTSISNCALCPAGRYCTSTGLDTPTALCSPGFYCSSGAAFANGTVNPIYGGIAGVCPYGHYCEAGTETATQNPCPVGSYNPVMMGTSSSACLNCTPGFYCANQGLANVTANCNAGYFCTSGCSDSICSNMCVGNCTLSSGGGPCPLGYYCPLGTLALAVPTLLNGTTTTRGAILPVPCPDGTYSPSEGSVSCSPCPAGFYCPIGSSAPQPIICPAGEYCPEGTGSVRPRCPNGTYSPQEGLNSSDSCYLCSGGWYCSSNGLTSPSGKCAQGYFCPGGASDQMGSPGIKGVLSSEWGLDINGHSICPAGFYCASGSVHPTPCPAGRFNPFAGGTNVSGSCSLCTGGSFCAVTNLTAVSGTCLAGYACPSGCVDDRCYVLAAPTTAVYGDCPAGYYCPAGTATPIACPNGTYAPNPNTVACTPCPAGQYCPLASISPIECPIGSYCPENSTSVQYCPAGSYGAKTNLSSVSQCTQCDPGMACTISGLSAPDFNCSAGYYCMIGAAQVDGTPGVVLNGTGGICPTGSYCPETTSAPFQCWNGTYQPNLGTTNSSACLPCAPGSYCNGTALSAVSGPCDPGFFCPGGDSSPITPENLCPAGHVCPLGSSTPTQCNIGTYNPLNGSSNATVSCLSCTPGMYCEAASVNPTGPCSAGFYCPGGNSVPQPPATPCLQQYFCPAQSSAPTNCTPGHYCATNQLHYPTGGCRNGYYCIHSASVPDPTDGITGNICPTGAYCGKNSSSPQLCPEGTYNPYTGQSSIYNCQLCTAGRYCGGVGLSDPTNLCAPGYYCPSGQSVPNPAAFICPVGHFCMAGATEPVPCAPGTHQDLEGQSSCKPCPAGYFCAGYDNVTDPVICPAGYFCINGTKFGNEYPCPAGTYSNKTGLMKQSQCTPCTPGYYCPTTGQVDDLLFKCDAGYYCTGGASVANPTDNITGNICPIGKYCDNGTAVPSNCPAGTYNVVEGLRNVGECQPCTPGFYCAGTGLTAPTGNCSAGFYCPAGESVPNRLVCPWGQYCPEQSASFRRCPSGTYTINEGQSDCMSCPEGFYCESTVPCNRYSAGSSTYGCMNLNYTCPRPCPLGFYCLAGTRNRHQYPCPAGFYGEQTQLTNAGNCTACPAGQYCAAPGVSTASGFYCNPGYWCMGGSTVANPTDNVTGVICPAGHYCPLGTVAPRRCPAGTYNPTTGGMNITACQLCTAGFACTTTGLSAPDANCSASYYCPGGQAVTTPPAYLCPFGWHCPAGSAAPVTCPSGTASLNRGLAVCQPCPAGYYCDISEKIYNRTTPRPCPTGFYCLEGTSFASQYPCPPGTASFMPGGATNATCLPCPGGKACPNWGTNETNLENCTAGFYCTAGANTTTPEDNITGAICPLGDYCPSGSVSPTPCPAGTLGLSLGLDNVSACSDCPAGFYCASPGATNYTGVCNAGFYCPGGQSVPNPPDFLCPGYYHCPIGSAAPAVCPNGYYTQASDLGRATCRICPAGSFCNLIEQQFPPFSRSYKYVEPTWCPRGYYCLTGTTAPYITPCPPGTYSNKTSLIHPTECTPCTPGRYCLNNASTSETGLCSSGYYCVLRSDNATPDVPYVSNVVGGLCPPGRYCPTGSAGERGRPCPSGTFWSGTGARNITACQSCSPGYYCQSEGQTLPTGDGQCSAGFYCPGGDKQSSDPAHICPAGHYCGLGSAGPTPCNGGTYNPSVGQTTCLDCPEYFYCPQNSTKPLLCIDKHYCPARTEYPLVCPNGTYAPSNVGAMNSILQCVVCPAGYFCSNGTISGACAAGYLCEYGNSAPNPDASNNGPRKKGDICPLGYYCPRGTTQKIACPNNTFGFQTGLQNAGDCSPCSPGFFCPENTILPQDCPAGSYCPGLADKVQGGSGIIPCPVGTYNNVTRATDLSFCLPCPNGYYCPEKGMASGYVHPTTSGYYSDLGQAEPYSCPGGTYQPLGDGVARNTSACISCPAGSFCSPASAMYLRCPEGTFCPDGTAFPFHCPGGAYCPLNASAPIDCPAGSYCPPLATFPVQCPNGTFCPPRTELPILCPGGYVSQNATVNRTDFNNSCQACPAGTWSTNTLYCLPCEAGHVCLGATPTGTPVDVELDKGYECPLGHYCPTGSSEASECPVGYFNNKTRGKTIADCAACPSGFFNPETGSFTCRACGRSSSSPAGSPECNCTGAFRSFQPEDSSCRCMPGYVFYSDGQRLSEEDAEYDCTPIVYETCNPSQVRSAQGDCVDLNSPLVCDSCPNSAGTVDPQLGICICTELPDVETICNATCRKNARRMFIQDGELVLIDPTTGNRTTLALDGATILGKKSCGLPGQTDCEIRVLQVGPNGMQAVFSPDSGIFGLANPAVSSSNAASSSRRIAATTSSTLNNPIVCLNLGETIFWDVSDPSRTHFPVYQKDNMLNTNRYFDYTEFRLLAERIRAPNLTFSSFMFSFTEAGIYVFADNANPYQLTIVRVVSASERCASNTSYSAMSQTSLVQLGVTRNKFGADAPDWVLIGVLMAGLFLLVAGIIGGLWHFRRQTWGLVGSALPRYRSLGMEYLSHRMAGRSGTAGGAQNGRSGGLVGAIQGAIVGNDGNSGLQSGWASSDDVDRLPAPPGSSKPILLRLDVHLRDFTPQEFIAIIAEEAGVLPENVLILSVTEGSTIVRFVISGCENTQDAANLLINRIADESNEIHSRLDILAFDATQGSEIAAGQHPAYVMQSIEDSYWDYERRIDLEGFNVRTLYDKLEDQTIHIVSQLSNQRDDLLLLCDKILVESEALKDMFFKVRVDLDDRSRRERNLLDLRERQMKNGKVDYDLPEDLKLMLTSFLNDFFKNHVMKITDEFGKISQPHLQRLEQLVNDPNALVIGPNGQPMTTAEAEAYYIAHSNQTQGHQAPSSLTGRAGLQSAGGMMGSLIEDPMLLSTGDDASIHLGADSASHHHDSAAAGKLMMLNHLRTTIDPMEFPAELRDGADIEDDERLIRAKKRENLLNRKLNRLRRATDGIIMPHGLDAEIKEPIEGLIDADEINRRAVERNEWNEKCRNARKEADEVPDYLQDSSKLGTDERLRRAQRRQILLFKRLRQLREGLTAVDIPDSMFANDDMTPEEREAIENKRNAYLDKKVVKLRRTRANAMVPLEMMDDSDLDDAQRESRQEQAESHSDNILRETTIMPGLPNELESGISTTFKKNRHDAKTDAIFRRYERARQALEECDLPEGLSDHSDLDEAERTKRAELREKQLAAMRQQHQYIGSTGKSNKDDSSSDPSSSKSAADGNNNNKNNAASSSSPKKDQNQQQGSDASKSENKQALSAAVAAAMAARSGVAHTIDIPLEFLDDEDLDDEERKLRAAQRNAYLKGRKSKFNERPPHNEDEPGISAAEKKRRQDINDAFIRGQAAMYGLTPEELAKQAKLARHEAKDIAKEGGDGKKALIDAKEVHEALQMPDEYKGSNIGDLRKRQAFAAGKRAAALLEEPEELDDYSLSAADRQALHENFARGKNANTMIGLPVHLQGNAALEEAFEYGRDVQRGKAFEEYLDVVRKEQGEPYALALNNMFQRGRLAAGVIAVPAEFAENPKAVRAFKVGLAGGELEKDASPEERAAYEKGLAARLKADFMMPDELRDDVPMLTDEEIATRRRLQAAFKTGMRAQAAEQELKRNDEDKNVRASDKQAYHSAFELGQKSQKSADELPAELDLSAPANANLDESARAKIAKQRHAFIMGRQAAHMSAAVTELVPELEGISHTQRTEIQNAFARGEKAQHKLEQLQDELKESADMDEAERQRKAKLRHAFAVGRQAVAASTYSQELQEMAEERELVEDLAKNGLPPSASSASGISGGNKSSTSTGVDKTGRQGQSSSSQQQQGDGELQEDSSSASSNNISAEKKEQLAKMKAEMEEEANKMRAEHHVAFKKLAHQQRVVASGEMAELEEEISADAKKTEFELNEMFEMERNKLSEKHRLREIAAGGKLSQEDRQAMLKEEEELKESQEKSREQLIEEALRASEEKRARLKEALKKNAINEQRLLKGLQQDQEKELARLHEEAEKDASRGKQTLDDELKAQKKQLMEKLAAREKRMKAKSQKEKEFMDQNLRDISAIERDDIETRIRQKEAMKIRRAEEMAKLGVMSPEELQEYIAQVHKETAAERESELAAFAARTKQERLEHEQELHEKHAAEKKSLLTEAQEQVESLLTKQKEEREKQDAAAPKLSQGAEKHLQLLLAQAKQREEMQKQIQKQIEDEQRRHALADKRVQEAAQREIQKAEREAGRKLTPEQRDAILNECAKNAASLESQRSEDEKKQRDEVKAKLEEKRRKREAELKKKQLEEMQKQMEEQERAAREREEQLKPKIAEAKVEISDAAKEEDERLKKEGEARLAEIRKKHEQEAREYQLALENDLERQKQQQIHRVQNEHERRLAEQKKKQQQQLSSANTDEERANLMKQFDNENAQLQAALSSEEAAQKEKMDSQLAARIARKKQLLEARQRREQTDASDANEDKRAEILRAAAMEGEMKAVQQLVEKDPAAAAKQEELAQAIMGERHRKEMGDLVQRQARQKHEEKEKWKNARESKLEAITLEIDAQIDKAVLDLPVGPDRDAKAAALRADGKKQIAQRCAALEQELDDEESRLLTDLETEQAEAQFNLKLQHLNEVSAACGLGSPEQAMSQIQARLARRAQEENERELLALKEAKEKEAKENEERLAREKEDFERKMDEEYQRRRQEQEEEMKRREREFAAKLAADRKSREQKALAAARASATAGAGDSKQAAELRKQLMAEGSEDESRLRAFMAQEHVRQKQEHDQLLAEKRSRLAARRKAASDTVTKKPEDAAAVEEQQQKQLEQQQQQQQQGSSSPSTSSTTQQQQQQSAAAQPLTEKLSQVLASASATPAPTNPSSTSTTTTTTQQVVVQQTGATSAPGMFGPANAGALNQWAQQVVLQVQASPLWSKLCNIEKLVQQQGELGLISYYIDAKDKSINENEGKLVKVDLANLNAQQYTTFFFGKAAIDNLKKNSTIFANLPPLEIAIASALPKSTAAMSAFCHSYVYDDANKTIFIRDTRLASIGEFSVILTHALAHIVACKKNDTPILSGWNDADPEFLAEFYPLLEAVTEEMLFTKATKAKRENGGSVVSAETLSEIEKVISGQSADRRENALKAFFHMN